MEDDIALDLVKLFPKSCELKGITDCHFRLSELKYFRRTRVIPQGFKSQEYYEDVFQIGSTVFHFPAIDHGIHALHSILSAQSLLYAFNLNKDEVIDEFEKIKRDAALKTLKKCVLDFG